MHRSWECMSRLFFFFFIAPSTEGKKRNHFSLFSAPRANNCFVRRTLTSRHAQCVVICSEACLPLYNSHGAHTHIHAASVARAREKERQKGGSQRVHFLTCILLVPPPTSAARALDNCCRIRMLVSRGPTVRILIEV